VLVDECVPLKLARSLTGHTFTTAQDRGWGGFKNGRLLELARIAAGAPAARGDVYWASQRAIHSRRPPLAEIFRHNSADS
jgi:hypothetical protein